MLLFQNHPPVQCPRVSSSQAGFTLVQLSIILTIAALVMVAVLPSYQLNLNTTAQTTTKMNAVLAALRQYQVATSTLPCPADATQATGSTSFGKAAANPGAGANNCAGGSPAANFVDSTNHIAIGAVPVKTLGLPADYAVDGFGRMLTYAVDTNATAACWSSAALKGGIQVTDNGAVNTAVAVLVSHGADGHGAYVPLTGSSGTATRLNAGSTDTDQLTNAHVNSSFVATTTLNSFVRKAPTSTFDDIIVYKNPYWSLNQMPQNAQNVATISTPLEGSYYSGLALQFVVSFKGNATVTVGGGTPRLALTVGSSTDYATYASGTGTQYLTFSYNPVVNADWAPNGISVASPISLNGGTIVVAGTNNCPLFFTPPSTSRITIPTLYVADSGNNRVQWFNNSATYENSYSTSLSTPSFVAVDPAGNFYVTDKGNNLVKKFNSSGTYISTGGFPIGNAGSNGAGKFSSPTGIAIDISGNIWVSDSGNNYIQEFNSSGTYITHCGNGTVSGPQGLAADNAGNVWVADTGNKVIRQISAACVLGTSLGGSGSGNGKFGASSPTGIAIDPAGFIWVTDGGNNRVQKFTPNTPPVYVTQFGSSGSATGKFGASSPSGIAIDSTGNIWTADPGNSRIQLFSNTANPPTYVGYTGSAGAGTGQFNAPIGLALSQSGAH